MSSIEKKKIWIHYNNSTSFGPGRVVENLYKGLKKLKDEVEIESKPSRADYIACLQYPNELGNFLPEKTLMGPNIFVLPFEMPHLCNKFRNFVVPSEWVKDKYVHYLDMSKKSIFVWPVGIDTDEWNDNNKKIAKDFFVYQKNTTDHLVKEAISAFERKGLSCSGVITYGKYNEDDLKNICSMSRFAVLCTKTESQGIGYMNILSSNTPCYVVNESTWTYENNPSITADATSVPYFSSECGMIVDSKDAARFSDSNVETFLADLKNYNPRKYILENHGLKASAKNYVNILETCFVQ